MLMSRLVKMFFTLLTFLSFSSTVTAADEKPCTFSQHTLSMEDAKSCIAQLDTYVETGNGKKGGHFSPQTYRVLSCEFIEKFCTSVGTAKNPTNRRVDELRECLIDAEDSDLGGPDQPDNQRLCLESLEKFSSYDQIKTCFAKGLGLDLKEFKNLQATVQGNVYYIINRQADIETIDSCFGFDRSQSN